MRALLCHLPTGLRLLTSMSKVENSLTCVCATFQCATYSDAVVDEEVELQIGAPSVGDWPICYELNITKPKIFGS